MATENKLLPTLKFEKTWMDPVAFPDRITDEMQIRGDMQYHHDVTKNYINDSLIPAIEAELIDKASRADLEEVARGQLPDGSVTKAKLNEALVEELDSKVSQESLSESLNETLNQVAELVYVSTPQIGDTVRTYRADLGENWMRCNGDLFDPETYPELAEITPAPEELVAAKLAKTHVLPATPASYSYTEAEGYQVFGVLDSSGVTVYYSTDRFITHKSTQLSTATGAASICVRRAGAHWIAAWCTSAGTIQTMYKEGALEGAWTLGATSGDSGYAAVFDIWFSSDYHIAAACISDSSGAGAKYPYILSSASPNFRNLVETRLSSSASNYRGWARTDSRFMFVGCNSTGTPLQVTYGATSSPTIGSATVSTDSANTTTSDNQSAGSYTYAGEKYMFKTDKVLYYSDDFQKNWKSLTFDRDLGVGRIGYARGKYIMVVSNKLVLIGDNLEDASTWSTLEYSASAVAEQTLGIDPTVLSDRVDFVCGKNMVTIPLYALPASDCAPLREYIKVKEVTE